MTTPAMTWVKGRKGWMKSYRGQMYSISCRQLGCEPTKEASVKFANEWWKKKQEELDKKVLPPTIPQVIQPELRRLTTERDFAALTGDEEEATRMSSAIDKLKEQAIKGKIPEHLSRVYLMPTDPSHTLKEKVVGRMTRTPTGNTIEAQIVDFLGDKEAEVHAGQIKPTTLEAIRLGLRDFRKSHGGRLLESINEATLKELVRSLLGEVAKKKCSSRTASGRLAAIKQFLRDRYRLGTLDRLPRNFDHVSIEHKNKTPRPYTPEEITTILGAAHPRMKLYLLIMLNIGATQIDVSELRKAQLQNGKITRKRTKEEDEENTPTISYPLWGETLQLLEKYQNTDKAEERLFLNASGNPLYSARIQNGKMIKTDSVKLIWQRFRKAKLANIDRAQLKRFRKTGASLLGDSDYADCKYHYLGHAPRSIADQSYTPPPQNRFDEAIRWLATKLDIK